MHQNDTFETLHGQTIETQEQPRLTLLLVDDDTRILDSQARALRARGHLVATAPSPATLRDIQATLHVDAIISDWSCGDGGGRAVIDECKASGTPCVIYTANYERAEQLRAEGEHVIEKPASVEDLLVTVLEAISATIVDAAVYGAAR